MNTLQPRSYRYFPGWTMLSIAAAAQYMSAPGQSYSVAALKKAMREGLKVSETDYALAYGFATVVSACMLPFVGRLIDRYGARVMLPVIASGLGLACILMSQISSLTQLYCAFGGVRSLGQGALSLVSVWIVGEWFESRRGIATAIAGLGGGFSVMTIPILNNYVVENYGWERAWIVLGIAVWVTMVVPSIVFLRDRPEMMGLLPDGRVPDGKSGERKSKAPINIELTSESWSVSEVIRNLTFWRLLTVPATSGLVGTGLVFHQVSLLGVHGITPAWALGAMSLQALFATTLSFPSGWATDRLPTRYLLAAAMGFLAAANLLVMTLPVIWMAGIYALFMGVHGSIIRSTGNVVWINYYGRSHQGAVRGVAWSVMILSAAAGPLPLAFSFDTFGSYEPALSLFMILPLFAACMVWTAHPPRKPLE